MQTKEEIEERKAKIEAARARVAALVGQRTNYPLAHEAFVRLWSTAIEMYVAQKKRWMSKGKEDSDLTYNDLHRMEGLQWFINRCRQLGFPTSKKEADAWDIKTGMIDKLKKDLEESRTSTFEVSQGEGMLLLMLATHAIEKDGLKEIAKLAYWKEEELEIPTMEAVKTMVYRLYQEAWYLPEEMKREPAEADDYARVVEDYLRKPTKPKRTSKKKAVEIPDHDTQEAEDMGEPEGPPEEDWGPEPAEHDMH